MLLCALVAPAFVATLAPAGLSTAPTPGWREVWLLGRSLVFALVTTLTSLVIGLASAWVLAHRNVPGRPFWRTFLFIPFLLPPYMTAIALLRVFELSQHLFIAALLFGLCTFPLVLFPTLAALEKLGGGMEESGWLTLGVPKTWSHVVWPLVSPFALAGASFVWMLSLVEYGVPSLLGVDTYALEIFALIQGYHDYGAAGLACLPLMACGLGPVILVLVWGYPKMRRLSTAQNSRPSQRSLGRPHWALLFLGMVSSLSVGFPLLSLATEAGHWRTFQRALWEAGPDVLNSLWLALLSTTLALILGAALGFLGGHRHAGLALLTLALPPALVALGLVSGSSRAGWSSTNLLLVWGLAARFLALSACLLSLSSEGTPPSQTEMARLSLSPWKAWYLSYFGLHKKAWLTAFCLTFALCMGDLSMSLLLTEPGTSTLSLRIFNLFHYGRSDLVSALCLILIGIVLSPAAVATCLERNPK